METRLNRTSIIEPKIKFYDGICLSEYEKLAARWNDILSIVHKELFKYVNDDNLCFDDETALFPMRSRLTGNYYIDSVSYIKHINSFGFQVMVNARLTEVLGGKEEDYLGLEVTLFTKAENDTFEVWSIDSSSI